MKTHVFILLLSISSIVHAQSVDWEPNRVVGEEYTFKVSGNPLTVDGEPVKFTYLGSTTDDNGQTVRYYTQINESRLSLVASQSNSTSKDQQLAVTISKGSIKTSKQVIGIEVTGGANIPFLAEGKVTVKGEISFQQAFSDEKSIEITVNVAKGKRVEVYEAELVSTYYQETLFPFEVGGYRKSMVYPIQSNIIETGSYELYESEIPTK